MSLVFSLVLVLGRVSTFLENKKMAVGVVLKLLAIAGKAEQVAQFKDRFPDAEATDFRYNWVPLARVRVIHVPTGEEITV